MRERETLDKTDLLFIIGRHCCSLVDVTMSPHIRLHKHTPRYGRCFPISFPPTSPTSTHSHQTHKLICWHYFRLCPIWFVGYGVFQCLLYAANDLLEHQDKFFEMQLSEPLFRHTVEERNIHKDT